MKLPLALLIILLTNVQLASAESSNPCAKIDNSTAEYDKSGAFTGCRITAVTPGSANDKAGIKAGQLVLPVNFQGGRPAN